MFDYTNPLVSDWIDKLSVEDAEALARKLYAAQAPTIRDLPVKDLQSQLELSWTPNAGELLMPATVTSDVIADGAVKVSKLDKAMHVYDQNDGGGELAIPNTGAPTYMQKASGANLACSISIPAGQSQTWEVYGRATVRADSANDTGVIFQVVANSTVICASYTGRLYWAVSGNGLQQYHTIVCPGHRVTLGAGSWFLYGRVAIANSSPYGAMLSRGADNGAIGARRVDYGTEGA